MSAINTNWEYNGLQFEIDMQDADFAKKYKDVFDKMGEDAAAIPKTGENFDIIEAYYNMYAGMFDGLFGDGTALKLADGKRSSTRLESAYESMLDFISAQNASVQERRGGMIIRYSPNRAQRRAEAHGK